MKKMIGRMGWKMLLLVLLVTAGVSQLCSCGDEINITTAPAGPSISGQITSGGTGLAGVTITLSGAGQETTTSDAAGNYTFTGLDNGSYTLTPARTGFIFNPASVVQTISGANVTALNFIATPNTLPTFTVSGTVTSGGNGLAGVTMNLSGAGTASVLTDASGNYLFGNLLNGAYTVTPTAPNYIFAPLNSAPVVNNANLTAVNFSAVPAADVQLVVCPASGTTNVTIADFSYTAAAITVGVNGIVKWTNNGPSTHTVTSGTSPNIDGKFNSPIMGVDVTVCYRFLATGTYPYFCTLHPAMTGSVIVQ